MKRVVLLGSFSIVFLLISCSTSSKQIEDLLTGIEKMSVKDTFNFTVQSRKFEILNGGHPPKYFIKHFGVNTSSRVEMDIVFIEYTDVDTMITILNQSSLNSSFIVANPNNMAFKKGEELKIISNDEYIFWEY